MRNRVVFSEFLILVLSKFSFGGINLLKMVSLQTLDTLQFRLGLFGRGGGHIPRLFLHYHKSNKLYGDGKSYLAQ